MDSGIQIVVSLILGLGLLVIAIMSLVGLGYLTNLGFGKKTYASMTTTQQNLMKMYIVLAWITLGLSVLSGLWRMMHH